MPSIGLGQKALPSMLAAKLHMLDSEMSLCNDSASLAGMCCQSPSGSLSEGRFLMCKFVIIEMQLQLSFHYIVGP